MVQEEALQKKVKQLEDQLQEVKRQDKERSDNEAHKVKVGPVNTLVTRYMTELD